MCRKETESEVRTLKISEVVERALEEMKPITRTSYLEELGFKIFPTNSSDCCYIVSGNGERNPTRCWNPTAADLMADDWKLVNEETTQRKRQPEKQMYSVKVRITGYKKTLKRIKKLKKEMKQLSKTAEQLAELREKLFGCCDILYLQNRSTGKKKQSDSFDNLIKKP